jgi:hypothetical protein
VRIRRCELIWKKSKKIGAANPGEHHSHIQRRIKSTFHTPGSSGQNLIPGSACHGFSLRLGRNHVNSLIFPAITAHLEGYTLLMGSWTGNYGFVTVSGGGSQFYVKPNR